MGSDHDDREHHHDHRTEQADAETAPPSAAAEASWTS
jgi:hypothetical protein